MRKNTPPPRATIVLYLHIMAAYDINLVFVVQLFGVILGSAQGGLGEASCLAMAAFYDSRTVITFWSSGTGFAGRNCPPSNPTPPHPFPSETPHPNGSLI